MDGSNSIKSSSGPMEIGFRRFNSALSDEYCMSPPSIPSITTSFESLDLPELPSNTEAIRPRRFSIVKNKSFTALSHGDNMGAVSQVTPSLLNNVLKESSSILSISTPSLLKSSPYSSAPPSSDTTPAHTPPSSPRTFRHHGFIVEREDCSAVQFGNNPKSFILSQMKALANPSDMSSKTVASAKLDNSPSAASASNPPISFEKNKKLTVTKKYVPKKSAFRELELFFPSSQ